MPHAKESLSPRFVRVGAPIFCAVLTSRGQSGVGCARLLPYSGHLVDFLGFSDVLEGILTGLHRVCPAMGLVWQSGSCKSWYGLNLTEATGSATSLSYHFRRSKIHGRLQRYADPKIQA